MFYATCKHVPQSNNVRYAVYVGSAKYAEEQYNGDRLLFCEDYVSAEGLLKQCSARDRGTSVSHIVALTHDRDTGVFIKAEDMREMTYDQFFELIFCTYTVKHIIETRCDAYYNPKEVECEHCHSKYIKS